MIAAIACLTMLGAVLGLGLGVAARKFVVLGDPLVEAVEALMPNTNCGQCGMAGCSAAARAIAAGEAPVTCCPSGGKALAVALADKLGIALDAGSMGDAGPKLARVTEDICIGCCKCLKACPTDAIVGAPRQIHNVFRDACTGCAACANVCPTEALHMRPIPVTLQHWHWPHPVAN